MDVSKELVRGCLLYDFKVGLSAAVTSRRICQAFGDSAVNELRTGRSQALNDKALQAAIENSSKTCGELARQFITSSETVRLHPHRLGKTYRLNKWVPHTLLEVHKQQRAALFIVAFSPP
ncbi:histone-lysine N-methyltransferase SETMAR [Trichonephila inaurata madagascariensis]|uniref:Histone-lysine N-methyltransferase SETMAR n=1 Tax=Trichonephila inaurata madagascariensis TaxID=2747483 RepID=A0A8X7CPP4_9ARAC|nr:histone-lysine N-methyltransferase SETMAR [Trichonephila inaurata madagascariensis]